MGSAGYQLSQVAELVEIILCYEVGPIDVLRWQGVCKAWRGTITGSRKLQRKLCLMPEASDDAPPADEDDPVQGNSNNIVPRPNEMLTNLLKDLARGNVYLNENRKVVPASKGRSPASWRQMFLSQPPVKQVKVAIFFEYSDSHIIGDESGEIIWARSHFTEILENPDGVRAGEIIRRMIKRQDQMEVPKTVCAEVLSVRPNGDEEAT
ncbi:hypothetical protein LTR85_009976 [Meristemomyces frigidus]|nr:hypothetical protein LTR85_009976 [Meristemomyces frigidus]